MKRVILSVLLLCLLLLSACVPEQGAGTPGPSPTPAVQSTSPPDSTPPVSPTPPMVPEASPTPAAQGTEEQSPAVVLPSIRPYPVDVAQEPPVWEGDAPVEAPDFLDAEQQELYRRAKNLYVHVFGVDTSMVEYNDMRYSEEEKRLLPLYEPDAYLEGEGVEFILNGQYYQTSVGRYRHWETFDAVVHSVFTDRFFQAHNENNIYIDYQGRLCYISASRADVGERNDYFPDTFERIETTEGRVRFYVIGYYSDPYPIQSEITELEDGTITWDGDARDERLRGGYEYRKRYEIVMVRTEAGWRFDRFFDTSTDEEWFGEEF